MAADLPPVESDRSWHGVWGAAILLLAIVAATTSGGSCAWLAGRVASTRVWGEDQASIAANWCLISYLASSLPFTLSSALGVRDGMGRRERASVTVVPHLLVGLLSFPLTFAGGFVGRLVGAGVGIFTAPFGSTWLDVAVNRSGQGCLIGVTFGVALPWLILLKTSSEVG